MGDHQFWVIIVLLWILCRRCLDHVIYQQAVGQRELLVKWIDFHASLGSYGKLVVGE